MNRKHAVWWALMGALLVVSLVALAGGVTFVLDKDSVSAGEPVKVTFNAPLPPEGAKYWITVIPAGAGDGEWGDWKYVDAGVKEVMVNGPTATGGYEVRLHDRYPELNYHVVYRKSLTVKGAQSAEITFSLASNSIPVGGKPKVTFSEPLPKSGAKYWITVAPAGSADSEWGQWQYVDVGVSSLELQPVPAAGKYEVRLHDRYPELNYHVISKQPLTVK